MTSLPHPPVPPIYAPRFPTPRLTPPSRLFALAISLGSLTLLLIASLLTPSPTGVGTHTHFAYFRMPPCNFLYTTGIPCPSCGMTTSFSYFVRARFLSSFLTQPMGFLLAFLCSLLFWVGLYESITARPAHRIFRQIPYTYWLLPLLGFAIAAWAWKILAHSRGWDVWT